MDEVSLNVQSIVSFLELIAPPELAESYDNVGLLIGSMDGPVTKVIVGLELTNGLLEEAIMKKCQLIIVHHPLIFKPCSRILSHEPIGNKIMRLIKENISVYVAHTNLDKSMGGLNDYFLKRLNIEPYNEIVLGNEIISSIRVGKIEEQTLLDFIKYIKKQLNLDYIHYCGDEKKLISKVGICTGSGMSFYKEAVENKVDVFITGDMKYHDATLANDLGVPIIDATHYGTEIIVADLFFEQLKNNFGHLEIFKYNGYENPIKSL